jgi:hypothetical protein
MITNKQIEQWAEHGSCNFICHTACERCHAERRELAAEVIRFRESYIEANDELGKAEAARDALAAALCRVITGWSGGTAELKTFHALLDAHAPGWRNAK